MADITATRQSEPLTLDQFFELVAEHQWSFLCDSYHDLFTAIKQEAELFKQAQYLGIAGVNMYVDAIQAAKQCEIEHRVTTAVQSVTQRHNEVMETFRQKYMKPIDFFREKLERHDWYYAYSDSGSVYKAGEAKEKALRSEAEAAGPEFVALFASFCQQRTDNIRKDC